MVAGRGSLSSPLNRKRRVSLPCRVDCVRTQDNLVLSTGLIVWNGHCKEIWKLTFKALTVFGINEIALWRASAFKIISLRWQIHIINPADKTKLSYNTPHRCSTTVSLETYPFIHARTQLKCQNCANSGVSVMFLGGEQLVFMGS